MSLPTHVGSVYYVPPSDTIEDIVEALRLQTAQTKEHMKKHGISSLSELVRPRRGSRRTPSPTEAFSEEEREAYRAKRAEEGLAHCRAQAAKAPMIGPVPVPSHHLPIEPSSTSAYPAHFYPPAPPPLPEPSADLLLSGPPPLFRDLSSVRWDDAVRSLSLLGSDILQVFSSSKDYSYFVRRTPQGVMEEIYHNDRLVEHRRHRPSPTCPNWKL